MRPDELIKKIGVLRSCHLCEGSVRGYLFMDGSGYESGPVFEIRCKCGFAMRARLTSENEWSDETERDALNVKEMRTVVGHWNVRETEDILLGENSEADQMVRESTEADEYLKSCEPSDAVRRAFRVSK